jgi:hypothetical protein
MCGRFTVKAIWAEIVALYRLTMDAPPHNLRPPYYQRRIRTTPPTSNAKPITRGKSIGRS